MGFFVSADASEAMSNGVVKLESWFKTLGQSSYTAVRVISKAEPVIVRVAIPALAFVAAMMDGFYNLVWFSAKAVTIGSRVTIQSLSGNRWGHFAENVTSKDLEIHFRKSMLFFGAMFAAPVVGAVDPGQLTEAYRKHELIYVEKEKTRFEKIKASVSKKWNALQSTIGKKWQEFRLTMRRHWVVTSILVAIAISAVGLVMIRRANRDGQIEFDPTKQSWMMANPVSSVMAAVVVLGSTSLSLWNLTKPPRPRWVM